MDKVIVVYANPRTQLKRLMERDHLEYDEAKRRIAAQLPIADKRQHADYIINSGDPPEEVAKQTEAIYQELKALAKQLS